MVAIMQSNYPEVIDRHNFLLKLEDFTVNFDEESDAPNTIQIVAPLAMLPSMRTLRARYISGNFHARINLQAFLWPASFSKGASTLTVVDFEFSAIDSRTFRSIIAGIAALRVFRYHHFSRIPGSRYEPSEIVAILEEYAGASLVELSLTATQRYLPYEELRKQQIRSLQHFTALRTVCADDRLFRERLQEVGFCFIVSASLPYLECSLTDCCSETMSCEQILT